MLMRRVALTGEARMNGRTEKALVAVRGERALATRDSAASRNLMANEYKESARCPEMRRRFNARNLSKICGLKFQNARAYVIRFGQMLLRSISVESERLEHGRYCCFNKREKSLPFVKEKERDWGKGRLLWETGAMMAASLHLVATKQWQKWFKKASTSIIRGVTDDNGRRWRRRHTAVKMWVASYPKINLQVHRLLNNDDNTTKANQPWRLSYSWVASSY